MQDFDALLLVVRWFHIVAAIVAIGGAAFLRFVLLPAAGSALTSEQHEGLRVAVRARWSRIVLGCIALLLVTGGVQFYLLALAPAIKPMPYHAIFSFKLIAALSVFFLGSALAGRSPGFAGMRESSGKWLGVMLVLAALIVGLSGLLAQVRSAALSAA